MKNWAIVTGASSGIGAAIAEKLAEKAYPILLCGRNTSQLKAIAVQLQEKYNIETRYIAADLSTLEGIEATKNAIQALPKVGVLVNNAGLGIWGKFESTAWSSQSAMLMLNNHALLELTHFTLPLIRASGGGHVLNVASTAAFQAVPGMALYSASKIFVIQFSRALAAELANEGILVSCLCPGATETAFVDRAGMKGSHLEKQAEKFNMKPEIVAETAVNGMLSGKLMIIPGIVNKLNYWATVILPDKLLEKAAAQLYLKKN